jgi:hypothetical protein
MKWKKMGRVFCPDCNNAKLRSHASNPLALHLEGDIFRVLYSGRDEQNRSSVGFVDIDISRRTVVYSHPEPIFVHGDRGSFFSHGVSIGNLYVCRGNQFILFMGWQVCPGEHWRGDIGRLALHDKKDLVLTPDYSLLGRDEEDPISLSYPWVILDQGILKMWYGSTVCWDAGNGEMIHIVKYATSTDGVNWQKHGQAIPYEVGVAQAFSRPSVVVGNDGYHMWFSYRDGKGTKYRIGYAHSSDGLCWETELNRSGIEISDSGWDSEMIEYPFVFDHKGQRFMLYNGNDYGRTGFGLAVLERDWPD